MKNHRNPSIWSEPKRLGEPQHHRRNIEADIEAPLAPCGIVDGRGGVLDGTTPQGVHARRVYGKPAEPRSDLELGGV